MLKLLLILIGLGIYTPTSSQNLTTGDPAPFLDVFKWTKGNPVKKFEKGTPYVIESGATWCGPCKAAITGLTSLSKKHQGKAVVMSFFVSETSLSGGLDFDYYVKRVQKYVSKHEISCLTAMDGPDEKLKINWIEPTNSAGLPKFFVIDTDGYIAYINHGYSQYAIKEINAPFIDATGFEGKIDYSITSEEFNSIFYNKDETSFSKSKAYLKKLEPYLEKGTHPMKVVVIRDPKPIKVIEK